LIRTPRRKYCSPLEPSKIPADIPNFLRLDEDDEGYSTDDHKESDALIPEENYDEYGKYLSAEVVLPSKGKHLLGKVMNQKRDHSGRSVNKPSKSPLLDTRVYDMQLPD